jgi:hypothetical protein
MRLETGIVKSEKSITRKPIGKHIPAATNTHLTIKGPIPKQRIGRNIMGVIGNDVLYSARTTCFGLEELVGDRNSKWAVS